MPLTEECCCILGRSVTRDNTRCFYLCGESRLGHYCLNSLDEEGSDVYSVTTNFYRVSLIRIILSNYNQALRYR